MIWCIKTYIIAYVKTQKNIGFIIHYVKYTAQLLFKIQSGHNDNVGGWQWH